jgi:hypothetical protein
MLLGTLKKSYNEKSSILDEEKNVTVDIENILQSQSETDAEILNKKDTDNH